MREYYDYCPASPREVEYRLKPAQVLSQADIPCLVYGEDALCFIHFVPTFCFKYHLVVADENHWERASEKLMSALGYQLYTGVDESLHESIIRDPNRTRVYRHSIHLQDITAGISPDYREIILVHPQTHFNLDVNDYSRSVSLPPYPDNIRFPTRAAFLDSLFDTYLDPNSGYYTSRDDGIFRMWITYLIEYTLRKEPVVLPNGDLEPEHAQLKSSLKPENQPIFDKIARDPTTNLINPDLGAQMRKEVFPKMGRFDLANRPLPKGSPGNPEYLQERRRKIREFSKTANLVKNQGVVPNTATK